ncbi:hypothetical protein OBBRIDRAFT_716113, partial [Obba rivulosa]
SVCAICLSTRAHDFHSCMAVTIWSGEPVRCTRDAKGRIVNLAGDALCTDWQRRHGCPQTANRWHRHECS